MAKSTTNSNKVKYGLKNVHYAIATFDDDGNVTYGTPKRIPGAVNLSLDASGDSEPFYGDNTTYYVSVANNGYEGDLEIALIPEDFAIDIFGEEPDSKNVIFERSDAVAQQFALLFEFTGDVKAIRHVLYNCTATRPKMESATTEDKIEVKTDTLSLTAAPLPNTGVVKAKTNTNTDTTVYDNWYKAVYEKAAEPVIPTE